MSRRQDKKNIMKLFLSSLEFQKDFRYKSKLCTFGLVKKKGFRAFTLDESKEQFHAVDRRQCFYSGGLFPLRRTRMFILMKYAETYWLWAELKCH